MSTILRPARLLALAVPFAIVLAACESPQVDEAEPAVEDVEGVEMEAGVGDMAGQIFAATLSPLNTGVMENTPGGQVRLEVRGDSLIIQVDATGLPPDMMHMQHFHGFADGSIARCPGMDADANDDGVVDVTETAEMAGTTMVPFHDDPVNLEIPAESYPQADAGGSYSYRQAVHLDSLRMAFEGEFDTRQLALSNRVVFLHGVPESAGLPETAGSVLGAPAHATLPIACGDLEGEPARCG